MLKTDSSLVFLAVKKKKGGIQKKVLENVGKVKI